MGRRLKDAQLDNRTARSKLLRRSEPYWRLITQGCHLGYYKGAKVGKWVARYRATGSGKGYFKTTLGEADDLLDADGELILNWTQAQAGACDWFGKRGANQVICVQTVGDALDAYLASFDGKSVLDTRSRIEQLIRPALGSLSLEELTAQHIRQWLRSRAETPARKRTRRGSEQQYKSLNSSEEIRRRRSTANRDLSVLKAALNRAFQSEWVQTDRAWRMVRPFPKADVPRLRYLSDAESRRLVNAMASDFRPLAQAALLTGARYGELLRLLVADFDIENQTLWLRETKSGTPRIVYLEEEGVRLFSQQSAGRKPSELVFRKGDGSPWKASHQRRPMLTACAAAKIDPPVTFHDLRRTYGARLAIRGVPITVIAEALGHADERITRRHYAHLSPSFVADTVRANVSGFGIVQKDNVRRMDHPKS